MRDQLAGCIGCGCLSIDRCALYNPEDRLGRNGSGPVLLRATDPANGNADPATPVEDAAKDP